MVHWSPQLTLQFGPLLQENLQRSVQVASQSLPKLLHVGEHGEAAPQSSEQIPPPLHAHDAPVHAGPEFEEEHARARAASSGTVISDRESTAAA